AAALTGHPSARAIRTPAGRAAARPRPRGPVAPRRRHTGPRPPARRLVGLLLVFVVAFVSIVGRLVVLQVKDARALGTLAVDQRLRRVALPAPRGVILDRSGQLLVMSVPAKAVYADPKLVRDPALEARILAGALHVNARVVTAELRAPNRFVYVARGVDPHVAAKLQARR